MAYHFDDFGEMMVCPKSKSKLVCDEESLVSVDPECRLQYDIRDGIPNMFPDDARTLSREEWSAIMTKHRRDPVSGEPLIDE